jgi:hypothetical protein
MASYVRRNFEHPKHWVQRRGGGYDQDLTNENKQFLDELVNEQYTGYKNIESPLREAPWKRQPFKKDAP